MSHTTRFTIGVAIAVLFAVSISLKYFGNSTSSYCLLSIPLLAVNWVLNNKIDENKIKIKWQKYSITLIACALAYAPFIIFVISPICNFTGANLNFLSAMFALCFLGLSLELAHTWTLPTPSVRTPNESIS